MLFLYFLNYEKNNAPPLVRFGFAYLLLFVLATIPTGIISKTTSPAPSGFEDPLAILPRPL